MGAALNLYDQDFYAWTQEQAKLIKEKSFDKLDLTHLFEEVEDMGNRHADEIDSRLQILLMHLLKWKYQPNLQSRSWQLTIKEQRLSLERRLKKMPSLKSKLPEIFNDSYAPALLNAEKETGLSESAFPTNCEWTIDQVLDNNFYPN
jgi:hypothetical protein